MNLVRSLYALFTAVAAVRPVYGDGSSAVDYTEPTVPATTTGSSAVDCTNAENIVECFQGFLKNEPTKSCVEECAGKCCSFTEGSIHGNACQGFTGSVCKDGSCIGNHACHEAGYTVPVTLIAGGSCQGYEACHGVGYDAIPDITITDASCIGPYSCHGAWYANRDNVGQISNGSCLGSSACNNLGRDSGNIPLVNNCCKSDNSCESFTTDTQLPEDCAAPTTTTTTTTIAANTPATSTTTTATVSATTTTIAVTTATTSTTPPPLPWIIDFNSFNGNFTVSSNEEITLVYLASLNRTVQVDALQMKGCEVNVSAANAELVISNVTKTDYDNTTQKITVTHDINMTLLGNSSIYNATTNKLNVCQRVKLVLESDDSKMLTVVEDVREIEVDFNLDFNYSISDTALEAATINQNKTETNVDNYIEAYKCNPGDDYSRDNNDHAPNTKIHLCIRSLSSDVLIDKLESMTATEQTSGVNIVLIENKESIKYPAITSLNRMDVMSPGPGPGVVVSTFLPFEPSVYDGKSKVDITGTIAMKLTGSPDARRLQADTIDSVGTGANAASFDIKVNLQQNIASAEDPIVSTGIVVSNGFCGLVLVFTPLYMMMW